MNKEEFEKLERQAEDELAEEVNEQIHKDIHNEFISLWNEVFDFCQENILELDPVIRIITAKFGRERSKQIKKQGYISKI